MNFQNQKIQKLISFFIIIGTLIPSVFVFVIPKETKAFWGVWDYNVIDTPLMIEQATQTITQEEIAAASTVGAGEQAAQTGLSFKEWAKEIGQQLLMAIARKVLQKMTQATINWINGGFHGSPLFVQNPGSFFKDIAKSEIKKTVDMFGYDSLRYPFGRDFALGVINGYRQTLANNASYSLSVVMRDPVYANNYRNNFNTGGWNAWLINTQYPQNNYPGFHLLASQELARKLQGTVQTAAQQVKDTLNQGQGFLSPKTCPTNPRYNNGTNEFVKPEFDASSYNKNWTENNTCPQPADAENPTEAEKAALAECERRYQQGLMEAKTTWMKDNFCPGGTVATTPGSVVSNQIMKAMGASQDQATFGAAMGNSLSAIFDALINHFLDKGLSSLASTVSSSPVKDTWTYAGQSLDSTASGSTWLNGPDEEINVYTLKRQIEGAKIGLCSNIKDTSGATVSDQKDLSETQCTKGLKTEDTDIGICTNIKNSTDSSINLEDQNNIPKSQCDLLGGKWSKTGTVPSNTPKWTETGEIKGDIDNTKEELALMNNPLCDPSDTINCGEENPNNPTNQDCDPYDKENCPITNPNNPNNPDYKKYPHYIPGIIQIITPTKEAARNLDICIPGPDKNWEERLAAAKDDAKRSIQNEVNSEDQLKTRAADDIVRELDFAVSTFKDWINTKMMIALPKSIIYMDAIKIAGDYTQKLKELNDARRVKYRALVRLQAIDESLANFSVQPDPGSEKEKELIIIKKQYDALKDSISSSATIESTRNELNTYKNQLSNFKKLNKECATERTEKGWSSIDPTGHGTTSTLNGISERDMFCEIPINAGYSHGEIIRQYDWHGEPLPTSPYTFRNPHGNDKGDKGYEDLPLVNAHWVFGDITCTGLCAWPGQIRLGNIGTIDLLPGIDHSPDDGRKNIEINCDAMFKSNSFDYIRDENVLN